MSKPDLSNISEEVREYIQSLEVSGRELSSGHKQLSARIAQMESDAIAQDKDAGRWKEVASRYESELNELRSQSEAYQGLQDSVHKSLEAQVAQLPPSMQDMVKDLPAARAIEIIPAMVSEMRITLPDNGAGLPTGHTAPHHKALTPVQREFIKATGRTEAEYRKGIEIQENREIF